MSHLGLRIFGGLLGFVHFSCGLVILFFEWFLDDFNSRYQVYDNQMLWVDCKNETNIPEYESNVRDAALEYCKNLPGNVKSMFFANRVYHPVDFSYIIGFVFIWTGLWHFLYITPIIWKMLINKMEYQYEETIQLRWIEYGPSAGAMMFLIAYFIGIEDINILMLVSILMWFAITSVAWSNNPTLAILVNATIMTYFWIRFGLLFEPTGVKFEEMPWFVTAIIVGEFIMFHSFIVVYYMERKCNLKASSAELLYYILSATSKLFLGAILTFYVFI